MLITIEGVLDAPTVTRLRHELATADWRDGRGSAGYLSSQVKRNRQLADNDPLALRLGSEILDALEGNPRFTAAALPARIMPPLFNCYSGGEAYGRHVDGAIRPVGGQRLRTDLSATLFLSDPEDYEGGALVIEDTYGPRDVKLGAGDMVLYPGTSVHRVAPVTRGERLAAFFWIQSLVRQDQQRQILFELDNAIQKIAGADPDQEALVDLAGVYHNLLRQWGDP